MIEPRIPASKLRGFSRRTKIKLRAAGFRLVYEMRDRELLVQIVIHGATGGGDPLDLASIEEEDLATPWQTSPPVSEISGPLPASLTLTLADCLSMERCRSTPTTA